MLLSSVDDGSNVVVVMVYADDNYCVASSTENVMMAKKQGEEN